MTPFLKGSWLPGVATILAVLACYGTTLVVVLLSLLGGSIAVNEHAWAGAVSAFAALATIAIAAAYRRHRSIWPTVVAVPGLALILRGNVRLVQPSDRACRLHMSDRRHHAGPAYARHVKRGSKSRLVGRT